MCGEAQENPRVIWLVKRGPEPDYNRAPWHPVIICTRKHTTRWEAGATDNQAWVWEHIRREGSSGWLLSRWRGLDIDYGHVVRSIVLPDGTHAAFVHDRTLEPWTLLAGAVWWSDERMPEWVRKAGVVEPRDAFTVNRILDDAGTCLLPYAQMRRVEERRARRARRACTCAPLRKPGDTAS